MVGDCVGFNGWVGVVFGLGFETAGAHAVILIPMLYLYNSILFLAVCVSEKIVMFGGPKLSEFILL